MTKGIITVIGKDKVGIIGKVCVLLSEQDVNILDISQTILGDFFNMLMIVDLDNNKIPFNELVTKLDECGQNLGVEF
ncbi:MAG: hypothetical protein BEN19_00900 [Epulopiscium sp. Nuni2H_MBin003]|nr:MAG: hypothetical protein BEN19_00900 [Epulopiscium sp. Nuni2H_MBin003]